MRASFKIVITVSEFIFGNLEEKWGIGINTA